MKYSTLITSRRNSFFSIITWIVLSLSTTILYHYIISAPGWTPANLNLIDNIYSIVHILTIVAIIVHIVSLLFQEFEHSFLADGTVIRRFLPLMKVIILAFIWIGGIFSILDGLHINTTSILTGTGIAGVLLAIASRDIITNLFGSLSILLSRTFDIGEMIRIRTKPWAIYEWIVEEITLNYTKLTHMSGEVVFIPNRTVYIETIENLSRRRFFEYIYRVPFRKQSNVSDIKTRMRIIEGKIASYNPIEVLYDTEIPNAVDLVYKITIMLPEENEKFDDDMRHFLMEHIFIEAAKDHNEVFKI